MKKKPLLSIIFFLSLGIFAVARPAPTDNKEAMSKNKSSFRNLVIDCLERSDSKSCHKAGVYILKHRDNQKKGVKYIAKACELGRGQSCKYLGDMYAKHYPETSQEYYEKGCLRNSKSACRLADKSKR